MHVATEGLVHTVRLGPVGGGRIFSLAHKHRVLATGASANDFLATDGGVVDQCRRLNLVDSALTGLVVAGEAPRVRLAVARNGETVVCAGSDSNDVGDS